MSERKNLIAKADALWRKIVKERADGRCQYNGCTNPGAEAHHILSRRHIATRHDLDNGILLCTECHAYAHKHPREFAAVMWLDMGFIFDGLQVKAKLILKQSAADLREIIEGLKRYGG